MKLQLALRTLYICILFWGESNSRENNDLDQKDRDPALLAK